MQAAMVFGRIYTSKAIKWLMIIISQQQQQSSDQNPFEKTNERL